MKVTLLAGACALALSTAAFAQGTTGPAATTPPSQGKGAPVTENKMSAPKAATTSNAMGNTRQTPGGEMGPSGQQAKPK